MSRPQSPARSSLPLSSTASPPPTLPGHGRPVLTFVVAVLLSTAAVHDVLGDRTLATQFLSPASWEQFVTAAGRFDTDSSPAVPPGQPPAPPRLASVPWWPCLLLWVVPWAAFAGLGVVPWTRSSEPSGLNRGWWSWLAIAAVLPFLWEIIWTIALISGSEGFVSLVGIAPVWVFSMSMALALCSLGPEGDPSPDSTAWRRARRGVLLGMVVYTMVFSAMNWGLYFNMRLPHGDSSMYEEHLWNLLHGKGFRSYLDQGLFLGEHIQVIHLGLLPLYILWPSHLLLELCESLALATSAWWVFRLAQVRGLSPRTAMWLGLSALLYMPLQFLDIEIDLKTFRPEAFGIPLLLWTLLQLERQRLVLFVAGVVLTYTVKEDYALIFGPLGLWIAGHAWWRQRTKTADSTMKTPFSGRRGEIVGVALVLVSVAYLALVLKVVLPWFRGGHDVHYARYYAEFGSSTSEVIWGMLTHPHVVALRLFTLPSMLFAVSLLVPMGGLALLSPSRLLVAAPLFGLLCLNNIAQDPRHQFHAPLVGILYWAAAAGAVNWNRWRLSLPDECDAPSPNPLVRFACRVDPGRWGASFAFATGIWFSLSPLGTAFWDPGSAWEWSRLYIPGERAREFQKVLALIPPTDRVASTDYVHTRLTHYDRSYDYSHYTRRVSGDTESVPPDTKWIVIDVHGPYSEVHSPQDVKEYRDSPDEWELIPLDTHGYFIVLKRKETTRSQR